MRTFSRATLSQFWFAFTHDGQAGISAAGQPFDLPAGDNGIRVTIKPVETPSGLPDDLYVDGNAYSINVQGVPGKQVLRIRRPLTITLRWPRLPHAIYRYSGGWTQLCSLRQATYTPGTIACSATTLGTYVAVIVGPSRTHPTLWSRLHDTAVRWTWAIVAIVVVVATAVGTSIVRRRRARSPSPDV